MDNRMEVDKEDEDMVDMQKARQEMNEGIRRGQIRRSLFQPNTDTGPFSENSGMQEQRPETPPPQMCPNTSTETQYSQGWHSLSSDQNSMEKLTPEQQQERENVQNYYAELNKKLLSAIGFS